MDNAYIIDSQDEEKVLWEKTDDQLQILNADQVIFADNLDDARKKIGLLYPVNNDDCSKYSLLFNRYKTNEYHNTIEILIEPVFNINLRRLNDNHPEYLNQFIKYIKDNGNFSYKDHPSEHAMYETKFFNLKHILNRHDVYIRPVKKELEYNPKLAAKQLKTIKEKKPSAATVLNEDINNLQTRLYQIITHFTAFRVEPGWGFNRTIKDTSAHCVLLIDIITKVVTPPTCYRQLEAFQHIKSIWKTISIERLDKFASNFCEFMDSELNKRKPKQNENFVNGLDCKTNHKFFKLYYSE